MEVWSDTSAISLRKGFMSDACMLGHSPMQMYNRDIVSRIWDTKLRTFQMVFPKIILCELDLVICFSPNNTSYITPIHAPVMVPIFAPPFVATHR